jgi:light-regulated signal transduction histidine kinase (bacteriophytochrome)
MITILSYCDTKEKKNQLLNLITGLKIKFPEKKILVYSHYQNLEPIYYKGTDYYIFDITNPISTKSFSDWIYVYHQYKKFYRSGDENTRKTKGTGLGLFIVRNLVELHKAKIQLHSNSPHGTKFEIKFKSNAE